MPGTTKISGFEAQTQTSGGDWKFDAGLGVMRSELGRFYAVDPRIGAVVACDPATGPASVSCRSLAGQEQTYAPNLTYNFGVQREFHVGGGTLIPRFNYGHVSQQWATLFENSALGDRIQSRNIANAQIAWQKDNYVLTLYSTNLSDQHYTAALNSGLRFAGPPRQYGLRLMKWFQ